MGCGLLAKASEIGAVQVSEHFFLLIFHHQRLLTNISIRPFPRSVDEDTISEYFPFPEVWKRLCSFLEDIFSIQIKRSEAQVWHEEVSYFELFDKTSKRKLGGFYVDPYSRFVISFLKIVLFTTRNNLNNLFDFLGSVKKFQRILG